jgi:hypothetical protein
MVYWIIIEAFLVDLETQKVKSLIIEVHVAEAFDMCY